jgi:hypothetical protein
MKIHEYQGKQLFRKYGVPVPIGIPAMSVEEALAAIPTVQQQAGTEDGKPQQQMGEGSYEATRDYQKDIKGYLEKADVEADAEAAKPRSEAEARELEEAEREGRSHSKGER